MSDIKKWATARIGGGLPKRAGQKHDDNRVAKREAEGRSDQASGRTSLPSTENHAAAYERAGNAKSKSDPALASSHYANAATAHAEAGNHGDAKAMLAKAESHHEAAGGSGKAVELNHARGAVAKAGGGDERKRDDDGKFA